MWLTDVQVPTRGIAAKIHQWAKNQGHSNVTAMSIANKHRDRQGVQTALREAMGQWGRLWHEQGHSDSEIQRRCYWTFGTDVMTAQTLGTEATVLTAAIRKELGL